MPNGDKGNDRQERYKGPTTRVGNERTGRNMMDVANVSVTAQMRLAATGY